MRLITDILETLYPTCCPGCGCVVDPNVPMVRGVLPQDLASEAPQFLFHRPPLGLLYLLRLCRCDPGLHHTDQVWRAAQQEARLCAAPFPLSLVGADGGVRIGDPYPAVFGEEEMARV